MSALSHPELVRRAAHLRARGLGWPQVAAALGVAPAVIEALPLVAPDGWAAAFADGLVALQAEAFAVCLRTLTEQMQSGDPKAVQAAGELLVKLHTANLRHRGRERREVGEGVTASDVATPRAAAPHLAAAPGGGTRPHAPGGDGVAADHGVIAAGEGVCRSVAGARTSGEVPPTRSGSPVSRNGTPAPDAPPKPASPPPRGRPIGMSTLRANTLTAFLKPPN